MADKKKSKKKKSKEAAANKNLPGYDIKINRFGELESNYDIDRVNEFLNENLEDKKLKNTVKKKRKEDKDDAENA